MSEDTTDDSSSHDATTASRDGSRLAEIIGDYMAEIGDGKETSPPKTFLREDPVIGMIREIATLRLLLGNALEWLPHVDPGLRDMAIYKGTKERIEAALADARDWTKIA